MAQCELLRDKGYLTNGSVNNFGSRSDIVQVLSIDSDLIYFKREADSTISIYRINGSNDSTYKLVTSTTINSSPIVFGMSFYGKNYLYFLGKNSVGENNKIYRADKNNVELVNFPTDQTEDFISLKSDHGKIYAVSSSGIFIAVPNESGLNVLKIDLYGLPLDELVLHRNDNTGGFSINNIDAFKNYLFFKSGNSLWKVNEEEKTFVLVKNFSALGFNVIKQFTSIGNKLYYVAGKINTTQLELWSTEVTKLKTILVKKINSSGSFVSELTNFNGTLFFKAGDGVTGLELWKSDGTSNGTVLVKDINTSGSSNPQNLTVSGNKLYFSALDSRGIELWSSDGTAPGTNIVKDIIPGPQYSNPDNFVSVNGTLYFRATLSGNNYELCKTDGTTNGTKLVKDIFLGRKGSYPEKLTKVNEKLFFIAESATSGNSFWSSNGTAAGTLPILFHKTAIVTGSTDPINLKQAGSTMFYSAVNPSIGRELWKTKGTTESTELVKDISLSSSSNPENLIAFNDSIYFTANDGVHGIELWKSNGTSNGTKMVANIASGATSSSPKFLTKIANQVYFVANEGINGVELWKTDGTTAGTHLVKDITPGATGTEFSYLINLKDTLLFIANNKLWKTDGTNAGTVVVKEDVQFFPPMGVSGNHVVLLGHESVHGKELWRTDGTLAGTNMVVELVPGADRIGSFDQIREFRIFSEFRQGTNGMLYFIGRDDRDDIEGMCCPFLGHTKDQVWATNGKASGTKLLAYFGPGEDQNYTNIKSLDVNDTTVYYIVYHHDGSMGSIANLSSSSFNTSNKKIIDLQGANSNIMNNRLDPFVVSIGENIYFENTYYSPDFSVITGAELFVYNKVEAKLFDDINPGSPNSFPAPFKFNEELYTVATVAGQGRQLCKCTIDAPIAREGNEANSEIESTELSPNPASTQVIVSSVEGLSQVTIASMSGNIARQLKFNGAPLKSAIAIDDLPQGMYIVQIIQSNGTLVKKKLVKM